MIAGPVGRERKRKLRISYLFPQFPVRTEVFGVSDINALRAQGHSVVVHTIKPPRRNESELLSICEVPEDLPIMRPTLRGILGWPVLLWRRRAQASMLIRKIFRASQAEPVTALVALFCIPRVLEALDEADALGSDVLHIFWSRHMGMALAASERPARPVLRSAFVGAYDLVADDFLVDLTLGSADVVFSHAEANRAYAESKVRAGVPVHVVRRGIPLPDLDDAKPRDRNRWVTASALVRSKNVEAVLRLFAAARRERPELRLSVFGDGPDRHRLEAVAAELQVAEGVDFAGHVSRSDLFAELQRSETFLLLSNKPSERLPNVLKEALWCGCSVIASPTQGIEELIIDSQMGVIVDPDAVEQSLHSIRPLFEESEATAARRRLRARRHIAENFSSAHSMSRYADAWVELLESTAVPASESSVARAPLRAGAPQPA